MISSHEQSSNLPLDSQKRKSKLTSQDWFYKLFSWNSLKWLLLVIALVLMASLILTFYQGMWGLGKWKDSSSLGDLGGSATETEVGWGSGFFRLKQLIITFLGGGVLAFAGCLLQKVTRNNLAEVSILGIGSINIMFIFAFVFIFKEKAFSGSGAGVALPFVTLSASILGTLFVWFVSRSPRANKNTFVIIGIAVQLLFEALSVVFINPSNLTGQEGKNIWSTVKSYTMGQVRVDSSPGAHPIPYWLIFLTAIVSAIVITFGLFLRKKIDIYETSEDLSVTLGVRVKRLRFYIFLMVAVLAGMEATILGTIALLGIIAPSIARLIFKNRFAPMAMASFIIGSILVMTASFISTNLGTHLPPGILTTTIASPYFIFLILRGR